jgi:hypothetical protein
VRAAKKESKENVWDIFQALLILGEDYIKLKYANNYERIWGHIPPKLV